MLRRLWRKEMGRERMFLVMLKLDCDLEGPRCSESAAKNSVSQLLPKPSLNLIFLAERARQYITTAAEQRHYNTRKHIYSRARLICQ